MKRSKGSWWSDPAAHEIFAVNQLLEDHPDVLITKLISGKVTFVHRKLWPQLLAVATARESWQLSDLSVEAKSLLRELDKAGSLSTDRTTKSPVSKVGETARELELKLLIHSEQIHTKSGTHAKLIETWESWTSRVNYHCGLPDSFKARRSLESRLDKVNEEYCGSGRLPWTTI